MAESNPFDVFSNAIVINLDRRRDRMFQVEESLAIVGLHQRMIRYSAVDHPNCGYRGSFESHVSAQEIVAALRRPQCAPALVCEDDIAFYDDCDHVLREAWSELKQESPWDLLYLNYNPESEPSLEEHGEHLYRVSFVKDVACFAVQHSAARRIAEAGRSYLDSLPDADAKPIPFDRWLAQTFHREMSVWAVRPMVAYQRRSASDNVPGDQPQKDWRRRGC